MSGSGTGIIACAHNYFDPIISCIACKNKFFYKNDKPFRSAPVEILH